MSVGTALALGDAGGPTVAPGPIVQPQALEGNRNCTLPDDGDFELRIQSPGDGTFTGTGGFSITLDVYNTPSGQAFDFFDVSGGIVTTVYVKAGPDTNKYDFGAGTDEAYFLHGTINPSNGRFYGLSHISICYNVVATPAISTQVSSGTITIGQSVTDTATVTGGNNPTGTVTFRAYSDAACSVLVFTSADRPLSGGTPNTATSEPFTPTAVGTYKWIATYNGDANNASVSGACGDAGETVVVNKDTPTIATQVSDDAIELGESVTDTATVSGGFNVTGTVTFNVYGPADPTCTGAPAFTSGPIALVAGSATSGSFMPTAVGTYLWIASYSGDANNDPDSGACGDANETVVVSLNVPGIATAPWVIPNDDATLSDLAGATPGGSLLFELWDNATCDGNLLYDETVAVTGNGTYSTANPGTGTGGYVIDADEIAYWKVTYSGDPNNDSAVSDCEEIVDVDLTP